MAQVDFVNYFSILFWFYILFVLYYCINYSIVFPSIYSILKTRYYLYKKYIYKLKSKFNGFIKNNTIITNNYNYAYIIFSFFLKKWLYLSII